jgi:hypothetical protein
MQAPRRGEVEFSGIAAQFEDHRRKGLQPGCFLCYPERVSGLIGLRQEEILGLDAEKRQKTTCIGETRLAEDFSRADPQQG